MNSPSDKPAQARPLRLKNAVQHYSWGMKNADAFIADLIGAQAERDQPFAELWMGTHPNAPSQILDPDRGLISLEDWIAEDPEAHLSLKRSNSFSNKLPYLFKVLSADTALSIQAHPNKAQAEYLHGDDPVHYPDDNHKPEIAIAIDSLDALVGLISSDDYRQLLLTVPEIQDLGLGDVSTYQDVRKAMLSLLELWDNDRSKIAVCIGSIYQRLTNSSDLNEIESLFLEQTNSHGQEDIGLLFIFFLNRVQLKAGEALFLPAGVPHAYLKGNIIECMANSDNVVRVGLTKKFCDTRALIKILSPVNTTDFSVKAHRAEDVTEYPTGTKEFLVKSLILSERSSRDFSEHAELSLFLVLDGEINFHWCSDQTSCCSVFRRGDSFVAPANLPEFTIQAKEGSTLFWVDLP